MPEKEKDKKKKYDFRHPSIRVVLVTVWGDEVELKGSRVEGDILSLNVNKSLDDACGTWDMTLVGRDNLKPVLNEFKQGRQNDADVKNGVSNISKDEKFSPFNIFRPMCLVDIFINEEEVMLGIVDNCERKSGVQDDGTPFRNYVITGRDMGAMLIDHKIWYDHNPNSADRGNFIVTIGLKGSESIGQTKPHLIIEDVYKKWLVNIVDEKKNNVNFGEFRFANNKKISDLITVDRRPGFGLSIENYGNYFPTSFETFNYEGDIFQFLKSFTSPPFNEFFVETGGTELSLHNTNGILGTEYLRRDLNKGQAHVVLRPTPYNDTDLDSDDAGNLLSIQDLPFHVIDDYDIIEKNLGVGRNGIPTYYLVSPVAGLITETIGKFFSTPVYDDRALGRYGHNPMVVQLDSFDTRSNSVRDSFKNISEEYAKRLHNWFRNSDRFYRGTIKLKGNSKIRVGQALYYNRTSIGSIDEPNGECHFYIRAISHSYTFGSSFFTTVTVDRGVSEGFVEEMKKDAKSVKQLQGVN